VAEHGIANFLEAQRVLLDLGKTQNEILMNGVKDRFGVDPRRRALIDLLQRTVNTFIEMHEEYLKIASKQSHTWLESAKAGKPYQPEHAIDLAREGMETFVKAQKRFLDVLADETAKATSGKHTDGGKKAKPMPLSEVAKEASDALLEAQKRLVDVAGRQMNANVQMAGKAVEMFKPFPFLPLNELTREVVKSYVDAQKSLMDVVVKPNGARTTERRPRKAPKRVKVETAAVA
jgi:exonuclease VII small subunit